LNITDITTAIKALFTISMFFAPAPPTLWFITMIVFFYIISPFLINGVMKGYTNIIWVLYAVLSLIFLIVDHFVNTIDHRVIIYFPSFYLGICTARPEVNNFRKKLSAILFIFGTAFSFLFPEMSLEQGWLRPTLMVSTASILVFTIFQNNIKIPNKIQKFIIMLSYSSFCIYLFHRPLYILLKHVYLPEKGVIQVLYLVLFCLLVIFPISYIIQLIYDFSLKNILKSIKHGIIGYCEFSSFIDYTCKHKSLKIDMSMIHRKEKYLIINEWVETGTQVK